MKNDGGGEGKVACHRCFDSLMDCFQIPLDGDVLWGVSNHIYGGTLLLVSRTGVGEFTELFFFLF